MKDELQGAPRGRRQSTLPWMNPNLSEDSSSSKPIDNDQPITAKREQEKANKMKSDDDDNSNKKPGTSTPEKVSLLKLDLQYYTHNTKKNLIS